MTDGDEQSKDAAYCSLAQPPDCQCGSLSGRQGVWAAAAKLVQSQATAPSVTVASPWRHLRAGKPQLVMMTFLKCCGANPLLEYISLSLSHLRPQ